MTLFKWENSTNYYVNVAHTIKFGIIDQNLYMPLDQICPHFWFSSAMNLNKLSLLKWREKSQ